MSTNQYNSEEVNVNSASYAWLNLLHIVIDCQNILGDKATHSPKGSSKLTHFWEI